MVNNIGGKIIIYHIVKKSKNGIYKRLAGFLERKKKMVAFSSHICPIADWRIDRNWWQ